MLTTLHIRNLALVDDLVLELEPGYNAITGETGAGKSLLIGALNLVLGMRAERGLIRSGCDSCTVEAVFETGSCARALQSFLEANGLEPGEAGQLILKRTLTAGGTTRQFINGSATTLQILAALGEGLVDLHGPHEHQSLLQPLRQLEMLDAYGDLQPLRDAFAQALQHRRALDTRKAALLDDGNLPQPKMDLLRHQVREIDAARLRPGEDTELARDYERAHNAARLLELSQAATRQLSEDELSLAAQAGALGRALQELQRLDPGADPLAALHEQLTGLVRELQRELGRYADRIELDPQRLRELEERLDLVQSLRRKYGSSVAAILQFADHAREQLRELENRETDLARLDAEIARADAELLSRGETLSARRRELIPGFVRAVRQELRGLGFPRSHFEVELTSPSGPPLTGERPVSSSGFDRVEFQFGPNPGEPARPLRAIASSGELARVMLALKTVLAVQDQVPLLVFDEVDANIAGETAHAVGRKMQKLGARRQVLCITHLAPVAAYASIHFVVHKEIQGERTITSIRRLAAPDRAGELARMMGGSSEIARQHARVLLETGAETAQKNPGNTTPKAGRS